MSQPNNTSRSFRERTGSILLDLPEVEVWVGRPSVSHDGTIVECEPLRSAQAVIDTGSTMTVISEDLAKSLGIDLEKGAVAKTWGIGGCHETRRESILLSIDANNGEPFEEVLPAMIAKMRKDVLIGMDLLRRGAFALNGPARQWRWMLPDLPKQRVVPRVRTAVKDTTVHLPNPFGSFDYPKGI